MTIKEIFNLVSTSPFADRFTPRAMSKLAQWIAREASLGALSSTPCIVEQITALTDEVPTHDALVEFGVESIDALQSAFDGFVLRVDDNRLLLVNF